MVLEDPEIGEVRAGEASKDILVKHTSELIKLQREVAKNCTGLGNESLRDRLYCTIVF